LPRLKFERLSGPLALDVRQAVPEKTDDEIGKFFMKDGAFGVPERIVTGDLPQKVRPL
jgi:hypothetical protein